jgi:hypothetical protein
MWGQKKKSSATCRKAISQFGGFFFIIPIFTMILKKFILFSLICSQIWLIPLVDDRQCRPITQFENKTLVRKWFQIQRKKSCSTLRGICCEELKEYILFQKV